MKFVAKTEKKLPYWESEAYEIEIRLQYGKTISDIGMDLLLGNNVRRIYYYRYEEWSMDLASRMRWNQLILEAFDEVFDLKGDPGNCITFESSQDGSSVGILFDKNNRHLELYKVTDDLTTRLRFALSDGDWLIIVK